MTASILSHLPLVAGSALLGTLSRAGAWTFSRYMQAPLASTGILAMVTLTALAGSNALYFQTTDHPSPFFAPARADVVAVPTPVQGRPEITTPASTVEAPMPLALPAVVPAAGPDVTGSVASVPDAPVGNAQIFAVQKKLLELRLFSGTVDGYYGPKTAEAIRTFEQRNGMRPTGAAESRVLDAIISSDANGRVTTPVSQPQAQAAPVPPANVQPAPVSQASAPPPAQQAFDDVTQTAANTIDSIMAAVEPRSVPQPVANPPVPAAPVVAQQQMPAPITPPVQQAASVAPAPVEQTAATAPAPYVAPATDTELVMQIQRGLASLGFFRAPVDGKPGPETARAIREFENFHSYRMTGQVKPDLVDLLRKANATI